MTLKAERVQLSKKMIRTEKNELNGWKSLRIEQKCVRISKLNTFCNGTKAKSAEIRMLGFRTSTVFNWAKQNNAKLSLMPEHDSYWHKNFTFDFCYATNAVMVCYSQVNPNLKFIFFKCKHLLLLKLRTKINKVALQY